MAIDPQKPIPRPAANPVAKPAARPVAGNARPQAMAAAPVHPSQMDDDEDGEYDDEFHQTRAIAVPSWVISGVFHVVALVLLAFLTMTVAKEEEKEVIEVAKEVEDVPIEKFIQEAPVDTPNESDLKTDVISPEVPEVDNQTDTDQLIQAEDDDSAPVPVDIDPLSSDTAPANDLANALGAFTGTGLSGRGAGARGRLLREGGGGANTEAAVRRALDWFKRHQFADGHWSFDHTKHPDCGGKCTGPGSLRNSPCGATAMGLLPFLGYGWTHQITSDFPKGPNYKNQVHKGLKFLVSHGKRQGQTLSFHEKGGSMYSHGLCAIALSEAYGMTQDPYLKLPAQYALNFIIQAQDPVGGGWRYTPGQAGDTSAVGWQIMALKSGHMAYLNVNSKTIQGASRFLDSVQGDSGATYGYTGPPNQRRARGADATSAIGLLCRMYLGWKRENPSLQRGIDSLAAKGPSRQNLYYDYYATQIMHHNGVGVNDAEGKARWEKWNHAMKEFLIPTQSRKGCSKGSWHFRGGDLGFGRGGRHYCTSMATMILEVYYRHLPLFSGQSTQDDFPL